PGSRHELLERCRSAHFQSTSRGRRTGDRGAGDQRASAGCCPARIVPAMKSVVASETQAYMLDQHTAPGSLGFKEGDAIRCVACGDRCLIGEGKRGICKVRSNVGGELRVPWGYVAALQCDPVEKKPFFHVLPGSDALTFGMLGCDYHCAYCQ